LRTSIGLLAEVRTVQLQKVEGVEECFGLIPTVAEQLEGGHAVLIAAHHLAIDQARTHLEMVHGLHHERVADCPVVTPAGDQSDAHGIATGHKPETIVLDLVNPVGAGRGLVGGGREAGFDEARPVSGEPLTHTLNQHARNLGRRSQESNRHFPP
jgi:hypothetical protein